MAFFKSNDPLKAMQQSTDIARANRDRLAAKLSECNAAVIARKNAAQVIALDAAADEAALDNAEAATSAVEKRATTIAGAIVEAEQLLAKLESDFATAADKQTRVATVAETDAMGIEINAVGHEVIVAINKLANVAERAGMCVPEARGLHAYCSSSATQIPDAVALIVKLLGDHATAVTTGLAPATLKRPEAPYVPTATAKPTTVALFALRPIKFRNLSGDLITVQKFRDAELTPSAAKRALELRACVQLSDPLRRQHHNTTPGNADPAFALDLDADANVSNVEPIQHSVFQSATVGAPYTVQIAREG